jgi:hypothetical protein
MRSSSWEYSGFVLVGVGSAMLVVGLLTYFSSQILQGRTLRYSSYPVPMVFLGVLMMIAGTIALIRSRRMSREDLPPPPIPPPPPPARAQIDGSQKRTRSRRRTLER